MASGRYVCRCGLDAWGYGVGLDWTGMCISGMLSLRTRLSPYVNTGIRGRKYEYGLWKELDSELTRSQIIAVSG